MLSDYFLTEQHALSTHIDYDYNAWMIVLSYAVITVAAYTAFGLVERMIAAPSKGARTKWLITGAVSMGLGIWTMHFVAMLAVQMGHNMVMRYDIALTALSAVFAMFAAGFAFDFVSRKSRKPIRLLFGGVVLGAGIGLMHYTGMLAMRMDALIRYDLMWFGASIVVAVVLATLALRMMFFTVEAREYDKADHRTWTAAVMGLAVSLMHYTGMAATSFLRTGEAARPVTEGLALDSLIGAVALGGVTFVVLAMAWWSASAEARRVADGRA
ncbi:MAG: hypothetical protein HKM95_10675 [Inquilinus sp.]|nr:hypothetical protein [Inquilinus sp.]